MSRIFTLVFAVALIGAAYGQEKATERIDFTTKAQQLTERMTEQLGLTAEQAAQVEIVNTMFMRKMMPAPGESAGPEARELAMKERDKELNGILTEDQFKHWTKLRSESNTRSVQPAKLTPVSVE